MRFESPEYLWLLPLVIIALLLKGRSGPSAAILFSSTAAFSSLGRQKKTITGIITFLFRSLPLFLLVFAVARPQLGSTTTEVEASGIDIMLAVDISGSMEAMDFFLKKERVTRLEAVKSVVATFINNRPNDRIGLIAFSGKPYLASPLTLDHDWLLKRLDSLQIGMIKDGTAIGSAIGSAMKRLENQKSKSQIIILLTDGMNNSGALLPLAAAEAAATLKMKIYTIGAGTKGKAPIPFTDSFGRKQLSMVRVDIDEDTLKKVAELTHAQYYRATSTDSLSKIYKAINRMETTTRKIRKFENYQDYYPWLILAALFFLLMSQLRNGLRLP